MKVVVYRGTQGTGMGGAENTIAVLTEALSRHYEVEYINHQPELTKEALEHFSHTSLERVKFSSHPVQPQPLPAGNWLQSWQSDTSWRADLSRDCDVFINIANGPPPFCHAPLGILRILFPFYGHVSHSRHPRAWYRRYEWHQRLSSYRLAYANSKFTAGWTKKIWGRECDVIYPPVDTNFQIAEKANGIISIGRYCVLGNCKKQLEMVTAFRELQTEHPSDWTYYSMGGLAKDDPADIEYFDAVAAVGEQTSAQILSNLKRPDMKALCERAKIFWHAAGFGEDDEANPGAAEHFGQATVEAMAAGCVPIVINKGGQPEIVDHGVNGFVWNTLDELKDYTRQLMLDDALRSRMSAAALEKSKRFTRAEFARQFLETIQRHTHHGAVA